MFFRIIMILVMLSGILSSSIVDGLAVREGVQIVFLVACGVIFCLGLLLRTGQGNHRLFERNLAICGISLASIAAFLDAYHGQLNPDGYKFVIVFMLLFVGSTLQGRPAVEKIAHDYWRLLAIYILVAFCAYLVLPVDHIFKVTGPGGHYQRLDVTGSVTLQGILGITYILLTSSLLYNRQRWHIRLFYCISMLPALYLVILSASRQTVLVMLVYLIILFFSRTPLRVSLFRFKVFGTLIVAAGLFFIFSALVSDAFYIRLFQNPADDYTSGRYSAIVFWLHKLTQHGAPLGFGYIGNYSYSDFNVLWPHNEFIRFYVEGGILGAGCILLLFLYPVFSLRVVLRNPCPPDIKSLAIIFVAILFVQILFDNLLHNIYRVTFYYLFLSAAAHHALTLGRQESKAYTGPPKHFPSTSSRQVLQ